MQRFKLRVVLTTLLLICLVLSHPLSTKATNQCEHFLLSGTVPADTNYYTDFEGTWGYSPSPSAASLIKFAPGTHIHAKATHNHPAQVHLSVGVGAYSIPVGEWDHDDSASPAEVYLTAPSYPNPDPLSGGYWFLKEYEVRGWKYLGHDGKWHADGTVNYTLSIFGDCR